MDTWIVSIFWFFWTELLRTGMYMYLFGYWFSILLGIDRGRISGSYGNYITLERPTVFFLHWLSHYFSSTICENSYFPVSPMTLVLFWFCFCLFKIIPILLGVKWQILLWFSFAFPSWLTMLEIFHGLLGYFCVFFREMSIQAISPCLNKAVCLVVVELWEFFVYCWY